MKLKATLLALALVLCLCLGATGASAEEAIYSHLGEELPDFTVSTIDGGTFTLSEALKEKDMVLINLWATWCGPCQMEFPYMEEAYELYQDKVEIIALSVEPTDTQDVLIQFAAEHGMTFPVGSDSEVGLGDIYATAGIPTTLVVDRFGKVAFIEIGSQPSTGVFTRLFDVFVGEHYTESVILDAIPPARPNVDRPDEAALGAALNVEGGSLAFRCADDEAVWPMIPMIDGVRNMLASSNKGGSETTAAVFTDVTAQAGDALAFDFRTSTEAAMDLLQVTVDGEIVKYFGGEHDWTTWAIPLAEGDHEIGFLYVKDMMEDGGDDVVMIDEVRVVSGEEAEALLAARPVYPTGDALAISVTSEDAREIVFEDEEGILDDYFFCESYWIIPDGTLEALITLPADTDPEAAFAYNNYDGLSVALAGAATDDGYVVAGGIDSVEETGYSYSNLYVYPTVDADPLSEVRGVMLFVSEENVNAFVLEMAEETGIELSWSYADGTPSVTDDVAQGQATVVEYTAVFTDQNGDAVPGCIINFCTDATCVPVVADENGTAVFTGAPYAYHLQVIKVPEGYEFDTTQEFTAEEEGGELAFTVTKK